MNTAPLLAHRDPDSVFAWRPDGPVSVGDYLADVAATIIARVQNWMRDEEDNQEEPVVIGVTPLDLSKLEKIKNLVGKAVVLAPRLFY